MRFHRLTAIALSATLALPAAAQVTHPSLTERVEALQSDPGRNGFEMGMMMGLRALEKLAQAQWQHGMSNGTMMFAPRIGSPNLAPRPVVADTVTDTFNTLLADMEQVRAVLENTPAEPFELNLSGLWMDIDGDGQVSKGESIAETLAPIFTGRRFSPRQGETGILPTIRFDEADHKWLLAYTHMLSGGASVGLAFDPAPIITQLRDAMPDLATIPSKPYPYTREELEAEIAVLKTQIDEIKGQETVLNEKLGPLRKEHRAMAENMGDATPEQRKQIQKDQRAFVEEHMRALINQQSEWSRVRRSLSAEIRAIENKMPPLRDETTDKSTGDKMLEERLRLQRPDMADRFRSAVDAIYILLKSLDQTPDAARLQAARDHWLNMIAINRQFWQEVEQETDDNAEWIPNASQTSALNMQIPPGAPAAWMNVLRDAEAVLQGDLLIPHPFLPKNTGIDLAAYIDNPSRLDLLGWVQGVSAYPYMATGPRITQQYWRAFGGMTDGRAGVFAFYFN